MWAVSSVVPVFCACSTRSSRLNSRGLTTKRVSDDLRSQRCFGRPRKDIASRDLSNIEHQACRVIVAVQLGAEEICCKSDVFQDPPVGVSWLNYPTLPAVRLPDRAPRLEGPGLFTLFC